MALRRLVVLAVALLTCSLPAPSAALGVGRTWFAQTGWAGSPAYRPHRLLISGDGAFFIKRMRWAYWGSLRAGGHGTAAVDNCKPNCADGTYHYYPTRVRLSYVKTACGRRFFTRVVVSYTKGHPAGSPGRVVLDPYQVYC